MGRPLIEVLALHGVLAAGYHSAAILSFCSVKRTVDTCNQQTSYFSANINHCNPYWITKPTAILLQLSSNVYWRWQIKAFDRKESKIEGIVIGDPEILNSLPIQLRMVHESEKLFC